MNSKNKLFSLCLVLAVSVFGFTVRAVAITGAAPDFDERLRQMTAKGEISSAEADLYRLYRVTAADRLPPSLRGERLAARNASQSMGKESSVSLPLRCGFPTIRRVSAALSRMPPDLRARAEEYLNPERRSSARGMNRSGWPVHLANTLETDHFQIEWGSSITDEEGHWPAADENRDSVPDVVEAWADYFETSFNEIVNSMNFNPAELVTGKKVQIFIGNSDFNTSIDNIYDAYAITYFSSGMPYIVVNNNFSWTLPNDAGPNLSDWIHGAMKATAAHEFFHVIHYLWEPSSWISSKDDWWFEASATWIEDEVFDSVNDYHNYFGEDGWADYVEQGLPSSYDDNVTVSHEYGAAIFGKYLSEHVDGQESVRNLWQLIRPSPGSGLRILPALDNYAKAMGFESLEELYLGFAAANATMDYEEGDKYGSVPIRSSSSNIAPAYLGSTYFYKEGIVGAKRFDLAASPNMSWNVPWGLSLAVRKADGHVLALGDIGIGVDVPARISAAGVEASDGLFVAASFLSETGNAVGYSFSWLNEPAPDVQPPAAVAGFQAWVQPGGFDLSWTLPGDLDLAGCVLSWDDGAGSSGSRTLFGPIEYVEVRGLDAATYDVSVFVYDQSGNVGASTSVEISVVEAAQDPDPPPFTSRVFQDPTYEIIDNNDSSNGSACFLKQLGLFGGN